MTDDSEYFEHIRQEIDIKTFCVFRHGSSGYKVGKHLDEQESGRLHGQLVHKGNSQHKIRANTSWMEQELFYIVFLLVSFSLS